MTLNTFHFAGHGAANVTLGIPRLREIVMTASQNIRTPTMQLPILAGVTEERLKTFCQSSTRLTLSQILDNVSVQEKLTPKSESNGYSRQKLYTVRLNFYPHADYSSEHKITSEQILAGIQRTLIPHLDKAILQEIKLNDREIRNQTGDFSKPSRKSLAGETLADVEEGDADAVAVGRDAGEEEDGDADDARRKKQGQDDTTYDDEDEEEDAPAVVNVEDAFGSDASSDEDEEEGEDKVKKTAEDRTSRMRQMQRKTVGSSRYVTALRFDIEGAGEFCEFDLEVSSAFDGVAFAVADSFSFCSSPLEPLSFCWSELWRSVVDLRLFTRFTAFRDVSLLKLRMRMLPQT